jgi:hypothetical protein
MVTPVSIPAGLTDVFTDYPYWKTLTMLNGWSSVNTPGCMLTENGLSVRIRGSIQAGTVTDGTTLFNLPAGMRPSVTQTVPVSVLSGGGVPVLLASLVVASSGDCAIYGMGANSFIRLAVEFTI